jgi:4'-phosphopantetheinyl transferase EntD
VIAAVAGYAGQVDGLGVDIEVDGPLESELISDVCTVGEVADIEEARPGELGIWSKVFFSAKESVHKATYPLAHSWLDFGDVELKLDFAGATFTAGLSSTAGPSSAGALGVPELGVLRGSFRLLRGLVWTGVVR